MSNQRSSRTWNPHSRSVWLAAQELIESRGVPSRGICPACEGGSTSEESLSIWRGDGDKLFATCHRDQCSVGTVRIYMWGIPYQEGTRSTDKAMLPSWASITGSDETYKDVIKYIKRRYPYPFGTITTDLCWVRDGCLVFPMLDRNSENRGYIVKRMLNQHVGPKSLTYVDKGYDGMSWYVSNDTYLTRGDLYVVEDVLSAIALYLLGHSAVSLNGTRVDRTRIEELSKGTERIVLCLDADATSTAIRAMRNFYNSFNITTRRLVKDFKDMTPEEIEGWMTTNMMYT